MKSKEGRFVFKGQRVYRDKITKRKLEMNGRRVYNRTRGNRVKLREEQQKDRISRMNKREKKEREQNK